MRQLVLISMDSTLKHFLLHHFQGNLTSFFTKILVFKYTRFVELHEVLHRSTHIHRISEYKQVKVCSESNNSI